MGVKGHEFLREPEPLLGLQLLGLDDQRCVVEGGGGEAPRLGSLRGASGSQLVCRPKHHPWIVGFLLRHLP